MDALSIINDPNFVPLAVDSSGVLFRTNTGEHFIIVSHSLTNRTQFGRARNWLLAPLTLNRGGGRP